ncbi:MAG: hypothetical protein AABZ58_14030 [Chloroflexota bacterium]
MLPPHELLPAHCVQLSGQYYLATGDGAGDLAALGAGAFSPVFIRYAYPRFETRRPFFPAMAADDRGALYRGLDAIDWLIASGLLFPRSDAAGMGPDGSEDQLFVKELDLAVPPLAYAAATEAEFPGVRLTAAIEIVEKATFALAPGANFPARLLSAIPAFQLNAAVPFTRATQLIPQAVVNARTISLYDL